MNRKQSLRRVISLCLVLTMVLGTLGISDWGSQAYATADGTAYVRIVGENNAEIISWKPVGIESGVTSIGAVVESACVSEGVDFELGEWAFPTTIGAIALSDGMYWMQRINDDVTPFNDGDYNSITLEDGDYISIYPDAYPSIIKYAYFTALDAALAPVSTYGETSYLNGSVTLKLQGDSGNCRNITLNITDESGNEYSAAEYDFGMPPDYSTGAAVTDENGQLDIELYGSCFPEELEDYSKIFVVSSDEGDIVKPYCKITLTSDGMTFTCPQGQSQGDDDGSDVIHKGDISSDVNAIIAGIRNPEFSHAGDYYIADWVLGMVAAGLTPSESEKQMFLTNVLDMAKNEVTSSNIGTQAKMAIALTALNIDASQVPDINSFSGTTVNMVNRIADFGDVESIDPAYSAPYILSLYDLGNYIVPINAEVTRAKLVQMILDAQDADGTWYGTYGADATGMVLPALALYYNRQVEVNDINVASCSAITEAVNKAVEYLSDNMSENGAFPGYMGSDSSNTNATVAIGLHALEINTHNSTDFLATASAMDNLLSYRTSDDRLGSSSNLSANDNSCRQGLCALATYQNLTNPRSSNLYHFSVDVAPYTNWPDADLLTSISVTNLPTKTQYSLNESGTVDTAGMVVKAMYNGEASTLMPVAIADCTVSTIDCSSAGNKTVTVTYQGQEATFVVTVRNADTTVPDATTARVSVKDGSKTLASGSYEIEDGKTSAMDILKTVLNDKGIDYVIKSNSYIVSIAGKGEFDEGANSGWLYSVNGSTPSTTAADDYELKSGDVVQWYYTLDYTTDSSSKKWSGTTVETAEEVKNVATGTAEVSAATGSNGTASAKVDAKTVTTAISDAEAAAKKTGDASTAVVIKVEADKAATAVETSIPKASVTELKNKIDAVTVKTPLADITLDKETLETIAAQVTADVKISVKTVDKASLTDVTEETKAEIADRPIYDFTVTSGDKTISEFGGKVSVNVPYTPATDEDISAIVIYYVNDRGGLEVVRDCKYDPATKTVRFSTKHFSAYVVGYNPVSFTDTKNHWAKEPIEYLAVRNLVDGMTETEFAPNNLITRAQFVQLLANLSGADLSTYSKSPFDDVTATAWYAAAADWAYETGVVTGTVSKDGKTYISPNANITRQDMAVMLARYAEKIEKYTITGANKSIAFSDDAGIAAYAKESVSKMQQAGIINGKTATAFAPTDNATRAEASKMLAAFQQKL